MIRILLSMFRAPEAERDPEAWATRLFGHVGVGVLLWLAALAILPESFQSETIPHLIAVLLSGPEGAALVVAIAYAAWEALQWRGGARMAFDGLLDWVAVIIAPCALVQVWHHQVGAAAAFVIALMAVVVAGVWRRL